MNFSDVKLLLPASGYMKTSVVDGRTVIDEMRDASYERNHQSFVGDDRPELHEDLQGRFFTCVEKESTNLFLNSESLSTQGVEVTADPHTVSFEGAGTIAFSGAHTGSLEGVEGERVEVTFTPSAGTLTCTVSGDVLKAQIEQSNYSTLYIPTSGTPVTRLAPSTVIENALPETGTVAGVVDCVHASDASNDRTQFVWPEAGSDFRIWLINGHFGFWLNGEDFRESSFVPPEFDRFKIAYMMNYSSERCVGWVLVNGSLYKIMNTTGAGVYEGDKNIILGRLPNRQTSIHFEKPWYKDDIVRVNATDEEIKAFFETLVKGTSMEMKAEDMVII